MADVEEKIVPSKTNNKSKVKKVTEEKNTSTQEILVPEDQPNMILEHPYQNTRDATYAIPSYKTQYQ